MIVLTIYVVILISLKIRYFVLLFLHLLLELVAET